ncbi:FAD-binding oxidoreductase [Pseudonocardia abyssalis]|uniref:FAD-binding oxidoreductase n=1 Tax=Pseudonocardia abyssalis TaxID=2792008 RepID=A0ABS6UZ72_9PSEU|nr:FAD-binding oxidoreductase [Pseudonocardia abyssalis]MBW0117851.1 FAD-binding oxidoreductase [Pseudonocardia abyssalis]MBW0137554.1 FAD-binding oxidoreductase [Pseudonocardia abyssalis]
MTASTHLVPQVSGPVLDGADPRVAVEVAAFNTTHTARPAVVVGATGTADVVAAVRWATANGLRVAVQSTGHGLVSDLAGTVLVTTHRMSAVAVDPAARTARVGAGVRWAQVIEAAAPFGLAPLSGSASGVGVVGYTLGGGLGPLARRHGFAADHVRSVELVTADGEVRHVDAISDPDLFWALRGGSGNFGIVTELEFDLVPVARLYGGGIFFPGAVAADVLHAYRTWVATLPEETTTSVALLRLPPLPTLPEPLRGQFVVHLRVAHLGPAEEGAALLAPMRAVAPALMDLVTDMPFAAVDSIHMDPTDPMPTWDRGTTLRELPAEAVDELLAIAGPDAVVPLIMVELRQLGGALGRPAAVPNAVAGRDAAFSVWALGPTAGPLAETMPAITQSVVDRMAPWAARGALLNFLGAAGPERVARLWGDADRERLLAVRDRLDPGRVLAPGLALTR